jgi:hypothetical protein
MTSSCSPQASKICSASNRFLIRASSRICLPFDLPMISIFFRLIQFYSVETEAEPKSWVDRRLSSCLLEGTIGQQY